MKLLIAGCGYLGRHFGKRMIDKGHQVFGICRSSQSLKLLQPFGIQPVQADLTDPESLNNFPDIDHLIFCQAPSHGDDMSYESIYFNATQNMLKACEAQALRRVIFISSSSVYGDRKGDWVDESSPLNISGLGKVEWLVKAEKMILDSHFPSVIFRLSGIYGPRKNRLNDLKTGVFKPTLSDSFTNRIHIDDIVSGMEILVESGAADEVYNGSDDEPTTQKNFYTWLYSELKMKVPGDATPNTFHRRGSKRCSNKKIKNLGLKLKYPTYREGYASLLRDLCST